MTNMQVGDPHALSKGSTPPPESASTLRLYSGRFCPYAARVRLVLNAKNIKCEVVNIDLKNKPEWYYEKNALGKVPLLEIKGPSGPSFISESLIIAEYLDDQYHDDFPLLPNDAPLERAQQKMLLEIIYSKITAQWHPLMVKEDTAKKAVLIKALGEVEQLLRGEYFAGEKPGFVDLCVWPWFERLPAVELFRGVPFTPTDYPKLTEWSEKMRVHPRIRDSIFSTELMLEFFQTRNPDVGLLSVILATFNFWTSQNPKPAAAANALELEMIILMPSNNTNSGASVGFTGVPMEIAAKDTAEKYANIHRVLGYQQRHPV
ncbi:putative Pyrimidodiazepine synthase [Hypsibius exemplaris]|uniref:Pyrimidodiazepine synthase n=1 Tax=Hypsibius exemplaris TaxID=2072580 RepID=A0A1W0XE01_HYPEX|nr:putative Pyrimidodiazepine synthase [Hypsibius exemplaris]